jgi:hypothetical protein
LLTIRARRDFDGWPGKIEAGWAGQARNPQQQPLRAVVLDAFGGAGSTLIACERTGRHARVIEIEPGYVDVIVRRWQGIAGKSATLEGDGRSFEDIAADRPSRPNVAEERAGGQLWSTRSWNPMSPLALARNHPDPRYDSTDSNNIGKSCVWVAGDALAPSRLNILSGDSERRISMKRVLRFVVRGLAGVVALGCVLGALLAYFVYTPAPEVPPLSGALVKRTIAVGGLERTYRTYVPRGLAAGAPLVVVMHGSGENGAQMREETGYGW